MIQVEIIHHQIVEREATPTLLLYDVILQTLVEPCGQYFEADVGGCCLHHQIAYSPKKHGSHCHQRNAAKGTFSRITSVTSSYHLVRPCGLSNGENRHYFVCLVAQLQQADALGKLTLRVASSARSK